jgi:flagellar biosynthesis/type III secretory pathway protein FliH
MSEEDVKLAAVEPESTYDEGYDKGYEVGYEEGKAEVLKAVEEVLARF